MAWVSITHCLWQDESNKNKTWKVHDSFGLFLFPPSAFCQYGSNLAQRHWQSFWPDCGTASGENHTVCTMKQKYKYKLTQDTNTTTKLTSNTNTNTKLTLSTKALTVFLIRLQHCSKENLTVNEIAFNSLQYFLSSIKDYNISYSE